MNEDFNQQIEKEIEDKGLNGPRVHKEQIEALKGKLVFTFGRISETRIICSAYLDGFAVADGFAACVDPKNFDEQIGMKIAHKNCVHAAHEKLWEFEGYRLSRSLNESAEREEPAERDIEPNGSVQ